MRNALSLMVVALLAIPAVAPADKRDDELLEIQRDIAQVGEQVGNLQKTQAAQAKDLADLRALVQQAASAASQASQDMAALKTALTASVNSALADQQAKMAQSIIGPLGARIDGLSTTVDQLNTSVGAINDRMTKLDREIGAVNDKVSTINQPAPAPPPPAGVAPDNGAANGVPPGVTKAGLEEEAQSDYLGNRDEMALKELADYVKYWPMDAWAPHAGYLMGMIYYRTKDYESAAEAFQAVIDKYPGIDQSQDALYQKARSLTAWPGHKAEAIKTFQDFVDMYPVNDNAVSARRELQTLKGTGQGKGRARSGSK